MKTSAESVRDAGSRGPRIHPSSYGPRISAETELLAATTAYYGWVAARLETLLVQVNYLSSDLLGDGGTAHAKRDWLAAHLTYETLGAVKRAFGRLDRAINAPIAGDSAAASGDTSATGFHKVEALLWSGAHMAEIKEAVGALRTLVARLVRNFRAAKARPTTIPLGLPKVVEEAIQIELSGLADAGSHTSLATIAANLAGADGALSFITPVLETRYAKLRETRAALASSQALVQSFARSGDWVPLAELTGDELSRLEFSLRDLKGLLKPIAIVCRGVH